MASKNTLKGMSFAVPRQLQGLLLLLILLLVSSVMAETVRDCENAIEKLNKQVKKSQLAFDEAKIEVTNAEKKVAELSDSIAKMKETAAQLNDKSSLERKIAKEEDRLAKYQKIKDDAALLQARANENLATLTQQLEDAKSRLEIAKAEAAAAATKAEAMKAKAQSFESPIERGKYANKPEHGWETKEVTMPWNDEPSEEKTILKGEKELKISEPAKKEFGVAGSKYEFDIAMLAGDKKIVEKLPVWEEWAEKIPFTPVTAEEIQEFYVQLVKTLKEQGYIFAKVDFPTRPWNNGIFVAKVDCGPLGKITVKNAKHFSEEQLRKKLSNPDGKFNYAKTYSDLFDLNSNPDLKLQTSLKPVIQGGRQVINAEVTVEDKIPIHGAIELRNDGSKESNDWRLRSTLQHLNVTDHFDTLTIEWLTGLFDKPFEDVNALSASYYLPIEDRWSFNFYGGWNESDIDDVLPEIGVKGRGYYLGTQLSHVLRETPKYRQQISLSWFYQVWKNKQDIAGKVFDDREITISMPGITLGHVDKAFDKFGGRNFASITAKVNQAGKYGSSDKRDFMTQGSPYADGDFFLVNLELARFQRLFDGEDAPGKWSLFMKTDVQFADDTLPPPAREYLGGFNSVRGYEESELGGDNAVTATLELRTPLIENFIPGMKKDSKFLDENPEYWGRHRLQFVAFTDFGYVENKTPAPGDINNQEFFSVGVGLRLGFTKYAQMAIDYGYALVDASDDTPDAGRFHISLQAQF